MKAVKKGILVLVAALAVGQTSMTAMAHGHGGGHHRSKVTVYSQCNVDECNAAKIHLHDGVYYCGHSLGDGHDYHIVCDVAGCKETAEHEHDDVICLPHSSNDGHSRGHCH